MKIIKNTTHYENSVLRSIICKVHAHMKKLEGKAAPNWKRLRVLVGANHKDSRTHGWAYYHGAGRKWDVRFSLPYSLDEHGFAWLVYHELMHTYGYDHSQYSNIPKRELNKLFPENKPLGPAVTKKAASRSEVVYGQFPIKIRMTAHTINELHDAEYASFEDWENANRDPELHPHGHTVEIVGRHKTVLEVRDEGELTEVLWAVDTGTFSIYCPGAANRLQSELRRHQQALKG